MKKKEISMKNFLRLFSISLAIGSLIALLCSCGYPDFVGNKIKKQHEYLLEFSALNREEKQDIEFNAGDEIQVQISIDEGDVSLSIYIKSGNEYIYRGNGLKNEKFSVTVQNSGRYVIAVKGEKAKGKVKLNY